MKKQTLLLGIAILLSCSVYTQNWVEFSPIESTKPALTVSISNDTLVKFNVTIPGVFDTPMDTFNRLEILEHMKMDSVGCPEMPVVSFLVAIPICDSVNLDIQLLDSIQFTGYNIYPAPELVTDTLESGAVALIEQFAYDTSAYNTDVMFPGYVGEAIDKGAIRGQNVIRVVLFPVQFNPVKNLIKAYSDLQITLTFNNPVGSFNKDVGIFNEVVGNTLINYESNGLNASVSCGAGLVNAGTWKWATNFPNDAIMDTCDYLLISDEYFFNEHAAKVFIDSLARHRAEFNGFDVVMVKMIDIEDSISGLNNKERIRNLIRNTYDLGFANNTYDEKLAYVNLFGDVDLWNGQENIPTHYEDPDHGGKDTYYTLLTQTNGAYDSYPDIMLGRCSVDDAAQVQNVVAKILNFNPNAYSIKNQCLLYCDDDTDFYEKINQEFGDIKSIIPGDSIYFITPNDFDSIYYHPDWVLKKPYMLETVLDVYEKELSVFHYLGHGSFHDLCAHNFSYSNLEIIHNDKLPFGFFNACSTGEFHLHDDCFCEQMLNQSSDLGMIATVGANKVVGINDNRGHSLINSLYYNSPVIGSAYLEAQLKVPSTVNDYNLLGDPALNLFYENIDTLKADIIVQKLSALNSLVNQEDTLKITAIISNLMNVDINVDFVTSCYLRQVGDPDYVLVASITTRVLDAFDHDSLDFFIPANQFIQDFYECKVMVDTAGVVDELSKLNNSAVIAVSVLNLYKVNTEEKINSTIVPVSYNMLNLADSNQIVAGTQIFAYDGSIVRNIEHDAAFHAGIGNTISGNVTFINTFSNAFEDINIASYTMDSVWSKSPVSNEFFGQSCVGFIDNSGDDFIFFNDVYYADTNWRYNLTCLDYKCNQIWKIEDFSRVYSISPDIQIAGLLFVPVVYFDKELNTYRIITITKNGEIYFVEENQNGQTFIADSLIIEGCDRVEGQLIAGVSGINQEIKFGVSFTDSNGKKCMALIDAGTMQYDTVQVSNAMISGPWMYDIDNNGEMEFVISVPGIGFYAYDDQLNETQVSDSTLYKFAGFCDAEIDDLPVIIYVVKEGMRYYLKAKNINDSVVFKLPWMFSGANYSITDKENNGKVDILINNSGDLYNIELLENSKPWMWQGYLGNLKNNCMFMQPAYYKSNDTVYWTDNILIPGAFEIPYGSTVVIKPGTQVFATEGAEFLVNGKLIAKGTENHTIQIRANIITSANNYWGGITAQTNGVVDLEYCRIENAEVGLFMYSQSPGSLKHNIFINNRVGICAYANSPDIIGNYFTGNEIAVASHASSTPRLVGGAFGNIPYYNGLIDNDTAIAIYNSLPKVKGGKNDIYNSSRGVYMIFTDDFPVNKLNVSNNYYGSSDTAVVIAHFIPSNKFTISPLLDTAQTNFKQLTLDPYEELLQQAFYQFEQQQYVPAAQMFQQFIMQYPDNYLALYAVPGEYLCYMYGEMLWDDFVQNMEHVLQDSLINTSIEKYAFEYKNLALRNKGDFATAIDNYENMLNQPVSYYDSLYAAINLAHTILESGLYKSSSIISGLDQKLIADDFSHVIRTKELLFSVPKDVNAFDPGKNCLNIINLYPNPAHQSFSIDFSACESGSMLIELYSVNGRKVHQKMLTHKSGINQFTFDIAAEEGKKINPGLYIVKLSSGSSEITEKVMVW